jgi:hypothetical protein
MKRAEKENFVKRFRQEFKKRFYFDITGFVIAVVLLCAFTFLIPLVSLFFDISLYYVFIILQSGTLIMLAWIWNELKNKDKYKGFED